MKIVRLPVRGRMLTWARETAGYSVADVAARLKKEPQEVESWEAEEAIPTLNQLRTLAALYKRPMGVLFRSLPPVEKQLPRDFRRLPGTFSAQPNQR
jgi:transcriptional regulator with XRE-family HTH domain